jgi:predicted ABC-type ATPase
MDEIYKSLTKGVRKPKQKVALFLCGAAGSGKTTSRSTFLDDAQMKTTFVTLNIDEVRPIVGTQELARKVFVELVDKAIDDGYSILYDATCRDKSNIVARMKQLKEKNYKIVLGITYASLKTVLERVRRRTEQPLDESIAKEIYQHLKKNVETYMGLGEIDEVYLYNNEQTSKLIYVRKSKKVFCMSPESNFYFDVSKYC